VRARHGTILWLPRRATGGTDRPAKSSARSVGCPTSQIRKRAEDPIAERPAMSAASPPRHVPAVITSRTEPCNYVADDRYRPAFSASTEERKSAHHAPTYVATTARRRLDENDNRAGRGQGLGLLRGGIRNFRRQHAAMAGQQLPLLSTTDGEIENIVHRPRSTSSSAARDMRCHGQDCRRSGAAQSA